MRKEIVVTTNNNKFMEEGKVKKLFGNVKKKLIPAVSGSVMAVRLMSTQCFAAATSTSAVTQPLTNLKTLVIAVIGAVGVIILAKNVMEFAQAWVIEGEEMEDKKTIELATQWGSTEKVQLEINCQTANYNRVQQQIKIPSDTYQTARSCL